MIAAPKHTQTENPPAPSDNTVERRVLKVWKDDIQQCRPKEVIIQLLKDGTVYDTVTLNAANNWRYTWDKLPKYNKDGSKIVWSVVEKELENYTVLITQDGVTFVVTNTYSPDKPTDDTVTRTVLKVWDDKGYESRRPKSVQVTLYVSSTRQYGFTFVLTNTLDKQKLPQTGVLWWPVPILAVAGLAFLIAGTLSRKKKGHE